MQALELNLASRPFRNNVLLWAVHLLSLTLLAGASVWMARAYTTHAQLVRDLRGTATSAEQKSGELAARERRAHEAIERRDLKTLQTVVDKANEVIHWKAFSWTRLFNRLEDVLPYGVRTTSVRPIFHGEGLQDRLRNTGRRGTSRVVAVDGVAVRLDALLELERNLLADTYFGGVEPERYTVGKNGEITFQLKFDYFPEGRADAAGQAEAGEADTA
ncbi:MAG TPA: hypothetical protein VJS92_08310, partial [Candidatus Polarisedimenticolaceae bacterium]|nr:hypothetical protein [Candidatus Polarisedimenticolaceae bacterium]